MLEVLGVSLLKYHFLRYPNLFQIIYSDSMTIVCCLPKNRDYKPCVANRNVIPSRGISASELLNKTILKKYLSHFL